MAEVVVAGAVAVVVHIVDGILSPAETARMVVIVADVVGAVVGPAVDNRRSQRKDR